MMVFDKAHAGTTGAAAANLNGLWLILEEGEGIVAAPVTERDFNHAQIGETFQSLEPSLTITYMIVQAWVENEVRYYFMHNQGTYLIGC